MKNFLPLIIVILIAIIFSILAFYSSSVIEGNTGMNSGNTGASSGTTGTSSGTTGTSSSSAVAPSGATVVDCEHSWNDWSTCNNFRQTRTINITKQPQNGGKACPTDQTEERFCATSSGTTNLATQCKRPTDLTGYEFDTENRVKATFEIGGLKCAKDYYGNPTSEACASTGTPYSLKGCHRIIIEATNTNPRILAVNFSKPISVRGSPGDLKNNFQYKVVSIDTDFKKVSDAVITSNSQIKLKIDKDIAKDQTVHIKYQQNKAVSKGGAELQIDDSKLNTIDQIAVVNNIVDNIPPKLQLIVVEHKNPNKLKLVFNETLQSNDSLDINDFEISINNKAGRKPNKVTIENNTLILDLRGNVSMNDSVTFKYTKNKAAEKQIKDLNNNSLLDIINITAINNVGFPNRDASASTQTGTGTSETWDQMYNRIYGRSNYGPDEESYYNEQYIKSIGAHNPFKYMNDKANIKCRVDPMNKSRAICDLGRNFPIQQYNVDQLKDNRGVDEDKYILKTKIVPAVNPRCPTCLDEDDFNSELKKDKKTDNPLALNDSVKKLLNIQDNISLDKFIRTIKTNPNLKINENLKNDLPNINMPQLNNNLKNELPNINMPQLNNNLKNELPRVNMPQFNDNLQSNIKDSSNFNAPQTKTQQFNNVLDNPMFNTGLKTPKLNTNLANQVSNTMNQAVPNAADVVNMDPRFLNENTPTPPIHEMGNVKTTNPSSGFIPRLTSFSSF